MTSRIMDKGETQTRKHNEARSDIRNWSRVTENVLKSCQSCSITDSIPILDKHISHLETINSSKGIVKEQPNAVYGQSQIQHLKGLKAVIEMLLATIPREQGVAIKISYIAFKDAYDLFMGYCPNSSPVINTNRDMKNRFKDLLCNPKFGLPVYVVANEFIVLKSNEMDIEFFLEALIGMLTCDAQPRRLEIDAEIVRQLLESMDTEWDRKVLRMILGADRSRTELSKLGIESDLITQITAEVLDVVKQRLDAKDTAEEMVSEKLQNKREKISEIVASLKKRKNFNQEKWNKEQMEDLNQTIDIYKDRLTETDQRINPKTSTDLQNLNDKMSRACVQ